jgi:hypothetical protein
MDLLDSLWTRWILYRLDGFSVDSMDNLWTWWILHGDVFLDTFILLLVMYLCLETNWKESLIGPDVRWQTHVQEIYSLSDSWICCVSLQICS